MSEYGRFIAMLREFGIPYSLHDMVFVFFTGVGDVTDVPRGAFMLTLNSKTREIHHTDGREIVAEVRHHTDGHEIVAKVTDDDE